MKASRGYTFHQHYDQLGLINMNGRVYDPIVGRFLSVDPVVGNPLSAQDYNGYSYCANNPLKYTDPSGYTKTMQQLILDCWNMTPNNGGGVYAFSGGEIDTNNSYIFTGNGNVYGVNPNGTMGAWLDGYYAGVTSICPEHGRHTVKFSTVKFAHNSRAFALGIYKRGGELVGLGAIVRSDSKLVGMDFVHNENDVEPKATGDASNLYSFTATTEQEKTSVTLLGRSTVKTYHSTTTGSGPINVSTNQDLVKTVSVNVNASPVVLNLSKDGVQFNCANLGQVESGPCINVFTGLSTDGLTIGGEYLDRNGVTHGASWSFIPNPGTTATVGVGVGVVVFFFTGVPAFAF